MYVNPASLGLQRPGTFSRLHKQFPARVVRASVLFGGGEAMYNSMVAALSGMYVKGGNDVWNRYIILVS